MMTKAPSERDLLEAVGYLLLMLHWQRGILDMCVQIGAIQLEGEWRENWDRVVKDLETFEKFAWEIAPARALLPILRYRRLTGELLEGYEVLLAKDSHGRIPYRVENLDDIEDLLRRVMDCRKFEETDVQRTKDVL